MVAPLPPHPVHRTERRSMSLEASGPHRMIQGASAVGARCRQRAQITQSHGVTRRGSARVAGVGFGAFQAMPQASGYLDCPESHEA
jgi:hypothetical protein